MHHENAFHLHLGICSPGNPQTDRKRQEKRKMCKATAGQDKAGRGGEGKGKEGKQKEMNRRVKISKRREKKKK